MFEHDVLKGQAAFIAGGTSGINREIAAAFVQAGAQVAVLSRKQEKVEDTVEYLRGLREDAHVLGFAADVRDYDGVNNAIGQTAELFGPLDIVVSGAAGLFIAPAETMSAGVRPSASKRYTLSARARRSRPSAWQSVTAWPVVMAPAKTRPMAMEPTYGE